jgi:general nucleoside transport system permease protein
MTHLRLEARTTPDPRQTVMFRILAAVAAIALAAIVLEATAGSSVAIISRAIHATFGTPYGLEQAAILATPIILTALSALLMLRMRLWNIGAEGQLLIGAWAATGVGLTFAGPSWMALPLMCAAGLVAGALWAAVPAFARVYAHTNEVITTLLLTPVAALIVNHFAIGPWRDRSVGTLVSSYRVPFELPLVLGTNVHAGFVIAVALAIAMAIAFRSTLWGYELTVIGLSRRAAEFAGMPVRRLMVSVFLMSGAIAGLAGMIEIAGTGHRLSGTISNGYGYIGLLVAVIAGNSALACVPLGFAFAALLNAGIVLQAQGISFNSVLALNGLILFAVGIGEVAGRYRLVRGAPDRTTSPLAEPSVGDK